MGNILRRVAIALGLVVAGVFLWIRRVDNGTATRPVVIAQKDLVAGASIDRSSLVVAQWPRGTIPAGAFTAVGAVVGRVTRTEVFKGEALVPGRLAPDGTGPGLEVKITPGKRAMSFRINDVSGIAGLIQPNSRVDILVVIDRGEKGRMAKLFMENMRILAIGVVPQRSEDGRPINAAVATVEVTPDEGERLAIATTQGQIQLMLRGYGDPDHVPGFGRQLAPPPRRLLKAGPCSGASQDSIVHDLVRWTCPIRATTVDTSRVVIVKPRR